MTLLLLWAGVGLVLGLPSPVLGVQDESGVAEDAAGAGSRLLDRIEETLAGGDTVAAYELLRDADWDMDALPAEDLARLAEIDLELWRPGLAVRIARLALERHAPPPAPADTGPDPLVRRMNRILAKALYVTARGGATTPELDRLDRATALETSASLLRDLVRAPEANPHDAFWLAAVLLEMDEREEARGVLDLYLSHVDQGGRLPGTERLRRCLSFQLDELPEAGALPETVDPPRKLASPRPGYTVAARHAELEGVVVIAAIIDREGRVVCPRPVQGLPLGLTELAVRTISRWRFEPATDAGEPLAVPYNITFEFDLGG